MRIAAKFQKVKLSEYLTVGSDEQYNNLKLPKRATTGSAGYDFYAPFDFTLNPGEAVKIPTGIKAIFPEDYVLILFPRSSLGFKYFISLANTCGVIDSDYQFSDNDGHIFIKLINRGSKTLNIKTGDAFAQGIFLPYFLTADDDTSGIRNGGFGSTNKK